MVKLKNRGMKIYGVHSKESLNCCVVFDYRGFSFSLSNIAKPAEFMIFENEKSTVNLTKHFVGYNSLSCTATDIRTACECVDDYLKRKAAGETIESELRKSGGQ
jgi:hypothetical protein